MSETGPYLFFRKNPLKKPELGILVKKMLVIWCLHNVFGKILTDAKISVSFYFLSVSVSVFGPKNLTFGFGFGFG